MHLETQSSASKFVLFQDQSVFDAMADVAALVSHLCDCEDNYGKQLIQRTIYDSLLHISDRLHRERLKQTE